MNDLIDHSSEKIQKLQKNSAGVSLTELIEFSSVTAKKVVKLKEYLFKNLYRSNEVNFMRSEAEGVVKGLFDYYLNSLDDIPTQFLENKYYLKFKSNRQRKLNLVGDFIASMTDKEALETFARISMRI